MIRWRAVGAEELLCREWDGEAVVFVCSTGDTHALSSEASLLLETMRQSPHTSLPVEKWFERLLSDTSASPTDQDSALLQFEQMLVGLEAIGAVRREAP